MSCGCSKGAIMPGCERHDPQARKVTRRPDYAWRRVTVCFLLAIFIFWLFARIGGVL